jgi:hypothetical protein
MGVYAPELLILYALDMFLVLSIITCLFDSHFPLAVPYFFQLMSIAGTGHMWVSRVFDNMFTVESRFWYSAFYMGAFIASSFAVSAYLFLAKRSTAKGLMFLGGYTFPSTVFGAYIITVFKNELPIPWFLRSDIVVIMMPVLFLLSFAILSAGVAMFATPDLDTSKLRESVLKFIADHTRRKERFEEEEEEAEEEEERSNVTYKKVYEEYNPVDFVHVTKEAAEHSEVDHDRQPRRE